MSRITVGARVMVTHWCCKAGAEIELGATWIVAEINNIKLVCALCGKPHPDVPFAVGAGHEQLRSGAPISWLLKIDPDEAFLRDETKEELPA